MTDLFLVYAGAVAAWLPIQYLSFWIGMQDRPDAIRRDGGMFKGSTVPRSPRSGVGGFGFGPESDPSRPLPPPPIHTPRPYNPVRSPK